MHASPDFLYLSRADIEGLGLSVEASLAAVEDAFRALHQRQASNGEKVGFHVGALNFFHAMPALLPAKGVAGVKWVAGADNAGRDLPNIAAIILLTDVETGAITAALDGDLITAIRPAAVSLAAARRLAKPDSSRLGFVACGAQAKAHFEALRSFFPINDVRCFSRSRATAEAFAATVRSHGITATAVASAAEAVADRDIVITSVPRNRELKRDLRPSLLAPGTFVCAPDLARSWIGDEISGFQRILTDDVEQSRSLGGKGMIPWSDRFDASLGELVGDTLEWGPDATGKTLFVHAGMGIGDMAVAQLCVERAKASNVGIWLKR